MEGHVNETHCEDESCKFKNKGTVTITVTSIFPPGTVMQSYEWKSSLAGSILINLTQSLRCSMKFLIPFTVNCQTLKHCEMSSSTCQHLVMY